MTFSDDELEKQYAPSQWARYAKSEEVLRDFTSETVRGSYIARNMIQGNFDVSYGKSDNQKMDIFGENKLPKEAPVFVFVHGGYWISGSRQDSSFPVRPLYEAGILSIVMGYDLVSDTFTLPELVTQIQHGIKFSLQFAQKRGSKGVYFCGHSAGAHLIAMALSTDPPEDELYKDVKGLVLLSGIYDLIPLLKTSNARAAHITKDIAEFCSPVKALATLKNNISCLVHVWICVAEHDSPAFQKQSEDYVDVMKKGGFTSVQYFRFTNGLDHFTLVQNLYDKDFFFTKKIIDFVVTENTKIRSDESKPKKKSTRKSISMMLDTDNIKTTDIAKSLRNMKNSEKDGAKCESGESSKTDAEASENDSTANESKNDDDKAVTTSEEKEGTEKEFTNTEKTAGNENNKMEVVENKIEENVSDNKSEETELGASKNDEQESAEKGVDEKLAEININEKQNETNEKDVEGNDKDTDNATVMNIEAGVSVIKMNQKETTAMEANGDEMGDSEADETAEMQATKREASAAEEDSTDANPKEISNSGSTQEPCEMNHTENFQSDPAQKKTYESKNNQSEASSNDGEKELSHNSHDVRAS